MSPHTLGRSLVARVPFDFQPINDTPYCQESHLRAILAVTSAVLTLAIVTVALRFYVRLRMLRLTGMDDLCMAISLVMAIGYQLCIYLQADHGLGRHDTCISPDDTKYLWEYAFFGGVFGIVGLVTAKISISFFLLRLVPHKAWRFSFIGLIVFLIGFLMTCLFTNLFACTPLKANYDLEARLKPSTRCFPMHIFISLGLFNTIVNCLTDFALALLPVLMLRKVQITRQAKITLLFLLGVGLFACAAGVSKAIFQMRFLQNPEVWFKNQFVISYSIEINLAIACGCLASLKPLFKLWLEKAALSSNGITKQSNSTNPSSRSGATRRRQDPFERAMNEMDDLRHDPEPTMFTHGENDPTSYSLKEVLKPGSLSQENSSPDEDWHSEVVSWPLPDSPRVLTPPFASPGDAYMRRISMIERHHQSLTISHDQHRKPYFPRSEEIYQETDSQTTASNFSWRPQEARDMIGCHTDSDISSRVSGYTSPEWQSMHPCQQVLPSSSGHAKTGDKHNDYMNTHRF